MRAIYKVNRVVFEYLPTSVSNLLSTIDFYRKGTGGTFNNGHCINKYLILYDNFVIFYSNQTLKAPYAWQLQSNLPMQPSLLCTHSIPLLSLNKFICIEPLLRDHLYYKIKGDLLIQVWLCSITWNIATLEEDTDGARCLLCIRCIIFDLFRFPIGDVRNATCIVFGLVRSLIVSTIVSISIESRQARQQFPYRGG